MYVVTGVTGHTGSAAAKTLLEGGQAVRVVVRDAARGEDWKRKGAEVAVADLTDSAALAKALAGADGAYLLIPPQYGAEDPIAAQRKMAESVAEAVRASGVPHVVFLSSLGAQHAEGTGPIRSLHETERIVGGAAQNRTILRAAFFLENWAGFLRNVREQGVLPSFLTPGRALPMVATGDIGAAAAQALLDPARGTRVIELTGPRDLSPEDVAAALSKKLGRPIRVQELPPEAAVPALTAVGFSTPAAKLLEEMYGAINSGRVAAEGSPAIARRGRLTPEDVLAPML